MLSFVSSLLPLAILALAQDAAPLSTQPDCTGILAIHPRCETREAAYSRDFFHVNGNYQQLTGSTAKIISNQFYVEKLTPKGGAKKPNPIVLFTAGVPSGAVRCCLTRQCPRLTLFTGMVEYAR